MKFNDEKRAFDSLVTQVSATPQHASVKHINGPGTINLFAKPKSASKYTGGRMPIGKPLLQTQKDQFKGKKTLVLDIDETLVHSSFKDFEIPDMILPVILEGQRINVQIMKRPGLEEFLNRMMDIYEVVFFTASLSKYANPLIDRLDPKGKSAGRLFRQHCTFTATGYVKDLRRLGRNLAETIIIDNSPVSFKLQPTNAIPIKSWFSDRSDKDLLDLIPILERLALVEDVRVILRKLTEMGFSSMRGNFFPVEKYSTVLQAEINRSRWNHDRKSAKERDGDITSPETSSERKAESRHGLRRPKRDTSLTQERVVLSKGIHSNSTSALLSQSQKLYKNPSPKQLVIKKGNRLVTVNSLISEIKTDGIKNAYNPTGRQSDSTLSKYPQSSSNDINSTNSQIKRHPLKSRLKPLTGVQSSYDAESSTTTTTPKDDLMINSPNSRYATKKGDGESKGDTPGGGGGKKKFDFSPSRVLKRSRLKQGSQAVLRQSVGATTDYKELVSLQVDLKGFGFRNSQTNPLKKLDTGTATFVKKAKTKSSRHASNSIGTRTSIKKVMAHPSK
eukprot:CAMPEP_0115014858 /NCGR_PEP_ID=MMETSP0216-20121206/26361_1 /TAXON_ID=223996 /ORGANISM="Protocruzia adherens, Strain Boccale" /LENGTH=559 /DNA_ID=CAMNT_0002384743 /DNA_START=157 /DNA_END=1836 /DNA_ORIENTATION=+